LRRGEGNYGALKQEIIKEVAGEVLGPVTIGSQCFDKEKCPNRAEYGSRRKRRGISWRRLLRKSVYTKVSPSRT